MLSTLNLSNLSSMYRHQKTNRWINLFFELTIELWRYSKEIGKRDAVCCFCGFKNK